MSSKELLCPLCHSQYNRLGNLPRLLTMCGHTYCQKCVKSLIVKKKDMKYKIRCPEDNCCLQFLSGKPSYFPKNLALLQVINNNKKTIIMTLPQQSFDVSHIKYTQNEQQVDNDITGQQFLEIIGDLQSKKSSNELEDKKMNSNYSDKYNFTDIDEKNICLGHQKIKDVVCIEHMKAICASCAIFGQHKGHTFKSIPQVEKQSRKQAEHIHQLLQEKQKFQQKITTQRKLEEQLTQKLSQKTQTIKQQIRQFYLKLLQNIEKSQKNILEQIEKIATQTLNKINLSKTYKEDAITAYNKWQFLAKLHLNILQSNSIEQKCQIIFGKESQISDVIQKGQELNSKNKIESIQIGQLEKIINGINFIINKEIFEIIGNCISVKTYNEGDSKIIQQRDTHLKIPVQNSYQTSYRSSYKTLKNQGSLLQQSIIIQQKQEQTEKNIINKVTSDIVYNKFEKTSSIHTDQQKTLVIQEKNKKSNKKNTLSCVSPLAKTQRLSFPSHAKKHSLPILRIPEKYSKFMKFDQNSEVQHIDLSNAKVTQNILVQIISGLPKCTKIKSLKLSRNNITDRFLQKIIDCLGGIISLNLSQNIMTDNSLKLIASKLKHLPNLKILNLSQNKIVERRNKSFIEQMRSHGLSLTI